MRYSIGNTTHGPYVLVRYNEEFINSSTILINYYDGCGSFSYRNTVVEYSKSCDSVKTFVEKEIYSVR